MMNELLISDSLKQNECRVEISVGRPKHTRVMTGGLEGDLFIGQAAEEIRGLLNLRYPMEHGMVKDWNDMEKIWQHLYSKSQLNSNSEEVTSLPIYTFDRDLIICIVCLIRNWLFGFCLASGAVDRGAAESASQSRESGRDLLRDVQRARSVHLHAGRAQSVLDRTHDRRGARLGRRRDSLGAHLRGLRAASLGDAQRHRRPRGHQVSQALVAQGGQRHQLHHERRVRDCQEHQRGYTSFYTNPFIHSFTNQVT